METVTEMVAAEVAAECKVEDVAAVMMKMAVGMVMPMAAIPMVVMPRVAMPMVPRMAVGTSELELKVVTTWGAPRRVHLAAPFVAQPVAVAADEGSLALH